MLLYTLPIFKKKVGEEYDKYRKTTYEEYVC